MKNKESKLLKYPLSSYQKDVWLEQRLYPGKPIYNIGGYIEIQGELDSNILAEAFESVVENNPIMQVVIKQENELDYQEIVAITNCLLPAYDFSECKNAKQFSLDWINKEFIKPFGFNEPLFQFALLKVSQHHYLVFGKTHHLIMDGWGYSVFVRQLLKRYRRLVSGAIDAEVTPSYIEFISEDYVAPENELEKRIFKIWQNILEVKQAGINDNFFNLGGHSLHAIMLVSAIYREFGVQIPLKAIFEYPTIRGMIQYMIKANFDSEYNVLLLNGRKDKNIFLFPAGGAFGLMYMEMVEEIGNFSCYAFDFIESDNRIKEYARIISEIQKIGPYILLGYSAGGNLAFEVAKELNDMGLEVSDLVLLDAVRRTEIIEINDKDISEEITRLTKNIIDGLKIKKIDIDYELMKQMALKKIEAYCKYRYNMVNRGVINTNIHLIYADIEHENSKLTEKKRNAWSECTTKSFTTYKGFGEHSKMLRDKQNVSIVRKIIND
jgi:thioesterase domain-containing protein/acyl carrier protein